MGVKVDRVPIIIGNDHVGHATIYRDGSIVCVFDPSTMGKKYAAMLAKNSNMELSVRPRLIPKKEQ